MNMFDDLPVDGPTAKRAHVGSMQAPAPSSGRAPAFGASAERTRSYQEEAAVPADVRSRLESIGMRTRFNVNRGYGMQFGSATSQSSAASAHPTHTAARANQLVTESDVLYHVLSTRSAWSRSASAPQWGNELQPFGGQDIRPALLATAAEENEAMQSIMTGDENQDPLAAHFGDYDDEAASNASSGRNGNNAFADLKRPREDASADASPSPQQDQFDAAMLDKPIRGLPAPVRRGGASMFGASRFNGGVTTLPVSRGLTDYLASNAVLPMSNANHGSDDASWAQHNFSNFAQSDAF